MRSGRPNKGVDHVDGLESEEGARNRLRVILATMTGACSVKEACRHLRISKTRFVQLRRQALQGAADALQPGRPGRPRRRDAATDERVDALTAELEEAQRALRLERLQTDLALVMPEVVTHLEKRGAAPKPRRSGGARR